MIFFGFLLVWVLSFLLGIVFGFLSRNISDNTKQPIALKEKPIVYEISEKENFEYRNFLSYDGSEQN